ncbi:hypothetical protein PDIDSM_1111 [Penicillium digitatum]|nr:hypothetical protein PDIDSM_1111 [Penicillium digitatum]
MAPEQWQEGIKYVGYGFVLMVNGTQIDTGAGAINSRSHVFDAEAIGAWRGLERAIAVAPPRSKIWLSGEGALRGSAIGMEAEPRLAGSDPSSGTSERGSLALWYRRWSDTYEIDSLPELELRRPALHAGLPSARRMATSTGTTASSTTKTPNSTAHAAAESHQSTSLSATKPRGLSDTGQNAPRHLQPTGQRQSPTFAAWTPSSLLNYWSSQASTRGSARGNSFICFLNKVFWHPPITTHLDPRDPRDPHPHDGRLTRRRQLSSTGYSALAFTNA